MLCHRRNDWQINCGIETPLCWHTVLPTPLSKPWNKCRPFVVEVFISWFSMHGTILPVEQELRTNKASPWPCGVTRVVRKTSLSAVHSDRHEASEMEQTVVLFEALRFLLSTVRTSWPTSGFVARCTCATHEPRPPLSESPGVNLLKAKLSTAIYLNTDADVTFCVLIKQINCPLKG